MKLVADEQLPRGILPPLRAAGHDIVHIGERSPGLPDEDILVLANAEARLMLTEDRDFGELIFRECLPAPGVIFIRMRATDINRKVEAVLALLSREGSNLLGRYTVLEANNVRMRPLLHAI